MPTMAPLMPTPDPIPAVSELRDQIDTCLLRDRRRLRRRIHELDERDADTGDWVALARAIDGSRTLAGRRAESRPSPAFPTELPITARLDEIRALLDEIERRS